MPLGVAGDAIGRGAKKSIVFSHAICFNLHAFKKQEVMYGRFAGPQHG